MEKRTFIGRFVVALALLLVGSGTAFANPLQRVDLFSSPIPLEMSVASGRAILNLERGIVNLHISNLPENPDTGAPAGATLSDSSTSPPTLMDAVCYRAWLMRVDIVDGDYFLTDGLDLGTMKLGKNEKGVLHFKAKTDLSGRGFNVIAVTAEADIASYGWAPGMMVEAFTVAGSSNGMIVLWAPLAPLP